MKKLAITAAFLALPLAALALETLEPPKCFTFRIDSPARDLVSPEDNKIIGCYLRVNEKQEMAFVKDDTGADLLTTALTERANGELKLKHFSMSHGQVVMAQQESYEINPLPIPATLKEAMESAQNEGESHSLIDSKTLEDVKKALSLYRNPVHKKVIIDAASQEQIVRDEEFYLPEEKQPTDGYWWPHTGVPLAKGPDSPLAKYDKYVESVTGRNPRSYEWERANHFTDTFWAGHCNGWVASSILYGYDGLTLRDHRNNALITASDLQGLRTATSYCVSTKVVGQRYRGDRSDVWDVYPDKFHKNLEYQIRFMRKPIAMDYLSMMPVDNHIVSGYQMTYQNSGPRSVLVTAKLRVHAYNYTKVHVDRVAKSYELVYKYHLFKDSRGRITGGKWLDPGSHPDFMWVPLAQAKCSGENPRMHHKFVDQMIKDLKPVRRRW